MRDELYWLAMTVFQEAGGEEFQGKLAVAYVVMTRSHERGRSVIDIVLQPQQFSCWNGNSPTRMNVDVRESDPSWQASYAAACAAYFGLQADPGKGANAYLNPQVLVNLPSWYDSARRTAVIGRHHFLKLP